MAGFFMRVAGEEDYKMFPLNRDGSIAAATACDGALPYQSTRPF